MKTTVNLVLSISLALWIMAIAIISVQNATPVSLRFITFESIQIPFGLVLAFCVAVGMIAASVLQPLLIKSNSKRSTSQRYEDDAEFFVDEEF
ncbi:MAG: LapA family protein [Cyanobacteria bacterium J06649_11]|nr:lipopolysaccharide assembly protein LapA domain-containing protein [Rivularia sp. ALOHA_DT_140]